MNTATPEREMTPSVSFHDASNLNMEVGNARMTLHSAIESRKQTERDVQLLLNRIQLLKNEENKALRNISMTRTRAAQLLNVKQDVVAREVERNAIERARQEQMMINQEKNNYLRQVSKQARENSRRQLEESKLRAAHDSKRALQKRIEDRLVEERSSKLRTIKRTEAIKQDRIDSRKRLEEERIIKLKSFHEEYEARIELEERQRLETEALVSRLEKEEMELIKRLQHAQDMQSKVYDELGMMPGSSGSAPATPIPNSAKSLGSSRKTPSSDRLPPRTPHSAKPTLCSLTRRDIGGAALR